MDVTLAPGRRRGTVEAIASKSFAHRVMLAAALADAPTEVGLNLFSADIEATLGVLPALGARAEIKTDGARIIPGGAETAPGREFSCGESGSTLRFLLPLLPATGRAARLTGGGRLPERPLSPLKELLAAHGAVFSADRLPFTVGGRLAPGRFALPGDVSSQYLTGLLLALPLLDGDSVIELTSPLQSAGYVDITREVLRRFAVETVKTAGGFTVPGRQRYRSPGRLAVEGDWSNAAFWLAARALGSDIEVTGLNPASVQPDRAIVDVLEKMRRPGPLELDVSQFPDLVPVLSVAAAVRPGATRFVNGARLRLKESDRISATVALLNALGSRATGTADGLSFPGGETLTGGTVDAANDHRLAMAAAVAATVARAPVTIRGAEAVNKSYPGFFTVFNALPPKPADIDAAPGPR